MALLMLGSAVAATSGPAHHPHTQDLERVRRAVALLAGEECGGRAAGTKGDAVARMWLVEQCRKLGLEPLPALAATDVGDAAVGDGYLQPFTLDNPRPAKWRGDTALWAPGPGEWRALELGTEAAPFKLSADGRARGEVVFAGYGIRAAELGWDDYGDLDVKGKVVLVLRGAPPGLRHNHGAAVREHMLFRTKAARAAAAGAVGMLLCNRVGESGPDDPSRALRAGGERLLPAFWISREVAQGLFAELADGLAARQAELDGDEREPGAGAPRGSLGVAVEMRVELEDSPLHLHTANVVGWIPGTDPERADEWIVLGAHYDHLGIRGTAPRRGEGTAELHPGADDNASGVAAVLEVAALLLAAPPPRPVAVVFFGAQELKRRGSRHFVESDAVERVVAMVNLDMVGRVRSQGLRLEGVAHGADLETRVRELAVAGDPAPALPLKILDKATTRSDHVTFLVAGIPAVQLTSGIHEQYQRPTDVDCLVEVEAMGPAVRWAHRLVVELAGGPIPEFVR